MSYTLIKTDKAMKSMQAILHFILYNFDEDTALERIDELEKSISQLSDNPYMGEKASDRTLAEQGYRVLTTRKDHVFYKVYDRSEEVVIFLVADQRQDYLKML